MPQARTFGGFVTLRTRFSYALVCGVMLWAASAIPQSFSWSTIAGLVGYTNYGYADGTNSDTRFREPAGLTMNSGGMIYVGDYGNNRIRQITPVGSDWVVTTIAGNGSTSSTPKDGTNTDATFWQPQGIVLDGAGSLFVADSGNDAIRRMVQVGTNWVTTTVAGGNSGFGHADGTNRLATFYNPNALALYNGGSLLVVDNGNSTIREITPYGTNWVTTTLAGLPMAQGSADGTNSGARFFNPNGVAADAQGNIYVADSGNDVIRKITPFGPDWVVTTIAGMAGAVGVVDGTNNAARFLAPFGIIVDSQGNLYVSEGADIRKIVHIGSDWIVSSIRGPHLNGPNALILDSSGTLRGRHSKQRHPFRPTQFCAATCYLR